MAFERRAQKSRTREALLEAARKLLAEGISLTIPAVAETANVSRATAYRYFSDPSVLALEAGLDVTTEAYEDIVTGCESAAERAKAVALALFDQAIEHEAEFRNYLSVWLGSWTRESRAPTRGARRVEMFRKAVASERSRIGDDACEQLVRALSVATGSEAMIALLDVAGADRDTARATVAHMANALVRAASGQVGPSDS